VRMCPKVCEGVRKCVEVKDGEMEAGKVGGAIVLYCEGGIRVVFAMAWYDGSRCYGTMRRSSAVHAQLLEGL